MDPIEQEIEQVAGRLEKASDSSAFSADLIKSTVNRLGAEGLKKAIVNLNDDQKQLLKSVLDEMVAEKVEKSKAIESANSTEEGEEQKNKKKPKQLEADEKVAAEAESKKTDEHCNQGDRPDGLPEPVIKSEATEETSEEDLEKGGSGSGRKPINPALAGIESVKQLAERSKDAEKVQTKFDSTPGAKGKPSKKKVKGEAKESMKKSLKEIVERMQDRKLEKSVCVEKLAKSMDVDADKLGVVWDRIAGVELEKGDVLAEKGNPEGSQSDVPAHMKDKKKGGNRTPDSGEPQTDPDKAEQPPQPMKKSEEEQPEVKKSDSFWHEEEEFYKAQAENPFEHRTINKSITYSVDSLIELQDASQTQRLAKSTFDYLEDEDEATLVKSEPDPAQQVVDANAKQKAEAEAEESEEIRNIKTNEKLSIIESQGQSMPMIKGKAKKLKKSYVDEYIAKGLDMDQHTLEAAQANAADTTESTFLVKSFDDADLDAEFEDQDMWAEKPGKQ